MHQAPKSPCSIKNDKMTSEHDSKDCVNQNEFDTWIYPLMHMPSVIRKVNIIRA